MADETPRAVKRRSFGRSHGPITRLVSPGDLGQLIKPFVFLDIFRVEANKPAGFGLHPHSGIATLTALTEGAMQMPGRLDGPDAVAAGGMEWMMAGGGVWHGGTLTSPTAARGFQLWVALPPSLENAPSKEIFLPPGAIPSVGPARVLLGTYQGAANAVPPPAAMTYLHLKLAAGDNWVFTPPEGHELAWVALDQGLVKAGETIRGGEVAVFEDGAARIRFTALEPSSFVLGSARRHPYPLVTGYYSVHTNQAALAQGEAKIVELGDELRRAGRLPPR